MTQEEQNRLTASLFRQLYFARMMHVENEYFLKICSHSGIKNALKRMKDGYVNGLQTVKSYLPVSSKKVDAELKASDEKIQAMVNIFEKIAMLDEQQVLDLETTFDEMVKVVY